MKHLRIVLALVGLAPGVGSCSLLGLADFDLAHCTMHAECEPLNTRDGLAPTACMRWQCTALAPATDGVCALQTLDADHDGHPPTRCQGDDCDDGAPTVFAHAPELCDGVDNSCDGVVDEGTLAPANGATLVRDIPSLTSVDLASTGAGVVGAAYQYEASAVHAGGFNALGGTQSMAMPLQQLGYQSEHVAATPSLADTGLVAGCVAGGGSPCDIADIALANVGTGEWLVAAVNTSGCAAGQLRVGYLNQSTPPAGQIIVRGPPARSPVASGVDTDASPCSGASRAGTSPGAARPSLAAIPTPPTGARYPEGVLAWLGATVARPECGDPTAAAVDVDALGVYLESGSAGGMTIDWVNTTGVTAGGMGGHVRPSVLGTTRGGGRPAVLATSSAFVVGFGDDAGHVKLVPVATFADPATMVDTMGNVAYQQTTRGTPDLAPGTALDIPVTGGAADHVAIAAGPAHAGAIELGIAWQTGCGAMGAQIGFVRANFTTGGSGGGSLAMVGTPIVVSTASDMVPTAPTLAYVPSGFVASGYMGATDATTGGWLVAWVDRGAGGHVIARRIAEFNGQPLEAAGADVTVGSGGPRLLAPLLYATAASPNVLGMVYGDPGTGTGTLQGATLLCSVTAH